MQGPKKDEKTPREESKPKEEEKPQGGKGSKKSEELKPKSRPANLEGWIVPKAKRAQPFSDEELSRIKKRLGVYFDFVCGHRAENHPERNESTWWHSKKGCQALANFMLETGFDAAIEPWQKGISKGTKSKKSSNDKRKWDHVCIGNGFRGRLSPTRNACDICWGRKPKKERRGSLSRRKLALLPKPEHPSLSPEP